MRNPSRSVRRCLALWSLVALGACTRARLPAPAVTVRVAAPGLSAEEVEARITRPTEIGLQRLPGAKSVHSVSLSGQAVVTVVFDPRSDMFASRSALMALLAEVDLPEGADAELDPLPGAAIVRYVLRSKGRSASELRELQDGDVRQRLARVPGVAAVASCGGEILDVEVLLDSARLRVVNGKLAQMTRPTRLCCSRW